MRTLWLFSMFHLHWTRIEKKTGLKQKKDIVYLTHVVSFSNYKENDVLLMIITVHILVQTTSSRLTSMNNIREKKIDFFSPHRSITMISYVQSFICTYILIYRKYRTISASCLCFVTHYYFSLSLLFFLSLPLALCYSLSNCPTLPTIAVQNSTYPVLVGDYSKHLNTHIRQYFFSSNVFFSRTSHFFYI